MNPWVPVVLGVVGALVSAAGAYIIAKRQRSGRIDTTEAETLWAESQAMRTELRNRAETLEAEVIALRAELAAQRIESAAMREEMVALRQEGIVLRAESVALREEMVTLREESVLLRKVDLKERLEERLSEQEGEP